MNKLSKFMLVGILIAIPSATSAMNEEVKRNAKIVAEKMNKTTESAVTAKLQKTDEYKTAYALFDSLADAIDNDTEITQVMLDEALSANKALNKIIEPGIVESEKSKAQDLRNRIFSSKNPKDYRPKKGDLDILNGILTEQEKQAEIAKTEAEQAKKRAELAQIKSDKESRDVEVLNSILSNLL